MQTLKDLQEKLFFECKSILRGLSKISSQEELLVKQDLLAELNERITILKYLEKNSDFFEDDKKIEIHHGEKDLYPPDNTEDQSEVEEEVIFNNELNEIHESHKTEESVPKYRLEDEPHSPEIILEINEPEPEAKEPPHFAVSEPESIENEEIIHIEEEEEYQNIVAEKEHDLQESEDVDLPEINPEALTVSETHITELFQFDLPPKESPANEEHHTERKFKLAHIKGLKGVPSLFEEKGKEEPTAGEAEDKPHQTISEIQPEQTEQGNLKKSNVPLNFMEAEKRRPEFRLDLNDKIAFSKVLFGGSQSDLNEAIRNLNRFSTLEDAKEYLSDLYYEKNWAKADEYAQRLWTLVENKFL